MTKSGMEWDPQAVIAAANAIYRQNRLEILFDKVYERANYVINRITRKYGW